jgi:hypothetical protein
MAVLAFLLAFAAQADTTYFQQHVDYRIEARLDEDAHTLRGRMRMQYRNNSSTQLDTLWFHLHLNAFRPNSRWAQRDLQFGERRFQNLGPDDHAFERVHRITVDGVSVSAVYPGAPDSTVMGVPLSRPLAPGATTVVDIDWDARPSTLPRRQGRRGRHYDFAQWYPRIAVFDRGGWQVQPLLPQGEFYGEFGTYDVTLDVAADQVIGATGVPVEGDPGWERVAAANTAPPVYRRDFYPERAGQPLGMLTSDAAGGRKRVRWRAEQVHHFAWTTNPQYIYESGTHRDIAIHVLYQPGDTAWDNGVVVQRTADALAFFEDIFGRYPWPQMTNVHRIEGGGTEFPMVVMNGSPSEGLILHEVGHNWVHGILANNEWKEGWLDEGFVSFLTNWAHERRGNPVNWRAELDAVAQFERQPGMQPISTAAADFRDFNTYGVMTYAKPSLVLRMLRWLMGEDAMVSALRKYFDAKRLQHVTEADLRAAVNSVHAENLDWFFDQWIHTTGTLDYRVGEVSTMQGGDGRWTTTVEIIRDGEIWMPVDLAVGGTTMRITSREPRHRVVVETAARPADVVLDPATILLDRDRGNNRKTF